jgi:aspartyl protease family protein
VQSEHGEGFIEVRLLGNGQGHFVADAINGQVVHFMLDTGATDVAIPAALARELNWKQPGAAEHCQRPTEGYRTRRRLQLGDIRLRTYAPWWCRAWTGHRAAGHERPATT